jgi:hypothetical protein
MSATYCFGIEMERELYPTFCTLLDSSIACKYA